jgi:SPP1 gp7 family putative phage head morphogenesis protein
MIVAPIDDLERLQDASASDLVNAITDLVEHPTGGQRQRAIEALADTLAANAGMADMLGRRRLLLEIDAKGAPASVRMSRTDSDGVPSTVPAVARVPFNEAIADMVRREPRLARSAAEVRRLYTRGNFFALARATEVVVTARVQESVIRALKTGKNTTSEIEMLGDWPQSYASTVYRTNMATAYARGRVAQASDPDVADYVAGWRYAATDDADVRPNHLALDGFVAARTDPVWSSITPPNGYNCRCTVEIADQDELIEAGVMDTDGRVHMQQIPHGGGRDVDF